MSLFQRFKRPFCLTVDNEEEEEDGFACPETCPGANKNTPSISSTISSFINEYTPEAELCPAGKLPQLLKTMKRPLELFPKRPVLGAKKSPSGISSSFIDKITPNTDLCPAGLLPKLVDTLKTPLKILPERPVIGSKTTPSDKSSDYSFIDESTSEVELGPVGSLPKLLETLKRPLTFPKRQVRFTEPDFRERLKNAFKLPEKKSEESVPGQKGESGPEESDEEESSGDEDDIPQKRSDFSGSTLYFKDGKRRIDMVLVYLDSDNENDRNMRTMYEHCLRRDGLEVELEPSSKSIDKKSNFLKIHIPWPIVRNYAESTKLKLPLKINGPLGVLAKSKNKNALLAFLNAPFDYNHKLIQDTGRFYMGTYTKSRENEFVINDPDTVFTPSQRSQIVWYIMRKIKFDRTVLDVTKMAPVHRPDEEAEIEEVNTNLIGVRRMITTKIYDSAFPVHDGRYQQDNVDGKPSKRRLLYLEWARFSKWHKRQPIGLIRNYFGRKIGLYFAWLGFYTGMLILPSLLGIMCIVYGVLTINMEENQPATDICYGEAAKIILCPICDKACDYVELGTFCWTAQLTYVFGNTASVIFATFMSFWSTLFLELWKRRQAALTWELDLQDSEEVEEPRPEFEESVKTFRSNPITKEWEPYQPSLKRWFNYTATGGIVLFMLAVVLATVLSTIIYRLSMLTVIYNFGNPYLKENSKVFVTCTGAVINLIAIVLLTKLYERLAEIMMQVENPSTQSEYEHSFTFKIFVFQFINCYSSLIYIALFKGRFFRNPGDAEARSSPILRLRTDVCEPTGCLAELCIQMFVIMVGKQFMNNLVEFVRPKVQNWLRKRTKKLSSVNFKKEYLSWEEDYANAPLEKLFLLEEYLEMILQYGFITLFIASFPLAPLFALINNVIEIRLDAYKMVTQMRRPVAQRVKDIGAWYGIMQALTFSAVVSNAFVIAYTSNFIPQLVYQISVSETHDLTGFVDWTFSDFKTSDYSEDMGSDNNKQDPTFCKYRGFRMGHDSEPPYTLSTMYWHVSAARFIFVVIFVLVVFAVPGVMAYFISDVPESVRTNILREKYIVEKSHKYAETKSPIARLKYKRAINRLLE